MKKILCAAISAFVIRTTAATAAEATLAETLCAAYEQVETVNCRIRKTSAVDGKTVTMLSQVYYQRPDRLHVENISPVKRRILADGRQFYYYQEGLAKGYSVPLTRLEGEWKIMQQSVPGGAMEHLARLRGVPEKPLDGTPAYPLRRGYVLEKLFAVLSCDAQGRLAKIEFYKTPAMKEKTAEIQYTDFHAAGVQCWLAGLQRTTTFFGATQFVETRRFDSLIINKPLASGLFDAGVFFPEIEFVDDFNKLTAAGSPNEP